MSIDPSVATPLAHAPKVYESDGNTVVEGWLDSDEVVRGGHVDVLIIGPDGAAIGEAQAAYRRPSSQAPAGPRGQYRGPRSQAESHTTYSVRFPGLPPQGSLVRVKSDASPHATPEGK